MGRCHYSSGKTNCQHRDDGLSGQCLPGGKPHLFCLESDVIQTAVRDVERNRILNMLGLTLEAARLNPGMHESRIALLATKTDKISGRIVYSRRIYWCACHVRDDDMITGVHVGSLTCKPGFEFISMEESRERMSLRNFVAPRLRHASPLAFAMSSENSSLSEEVVQQRDAMKRLKIEFASTDRTVQLQLTAANEQLAAANDTIKRLTEENSSLELRLIAQDERIRQLSLPRKDINAVLANIRREYIRMDLEAQDFMMALPHDMATIKELCRRSGVIIAPHKLCQLL